MDESLPKIKHPPCLKCHHFFVTWESARPKGCRAYGFKSMQVPALLVYESSGSPCLRFSAKKNK